MKIHFNSNYNFAPLTQINNRFLTNQQKRILSIYCLSMVLVLAVSVSTMLYCVFKKQKENLDDTTFKTDKLKKVLENKPNTNENATPVQVPPPPVIDPVLVKKTAITKELMTLTNKVYVEMTKIKGQEMKSLPSGDWRFNSYMIGDQLQDAINDICLQFMKIKDNEEFLKKKLDHIKKCLSKGHSSIADQFIIPQINLADSSQAISWKTHIYQNQLEMCKSSNDCYLIMKNAFGQKGEWVSDLYQNTKNFLNHDLKEVEKFSNSTDDLFKSLSQHNVFINTKLDVTTINDAIKQIEQKVKILEVAAQNFEKIMELAQDALPEKFI